MLFSRTSTNPTDNHPQTLLNPFVHNLNDNTNNVPTENTHNKLAVANHKRYVIVAIITSHGRVCPYLLPHHWEHALTGPDPDLDGRSFAFDGELVKNQGHTVKLDTAVFCLLINQLMVTIVGQVYAAIT